MLEGSWCPECYYERSHKYTCDSEFFSRDTEESFYVAGFLAADGWKTRKGGGAYTLGLQLAKKDFDHLAKIRDAMKSDAKFYYQERTKNSTKTYSYIIRNKTIYNDLKRFGVIENKTYIMTMPDWLKDHALVRHFIRGYVDGDGSFSVAKNKEQKPHILFGMRGTVEFLNSIYEIFKRENIIQREHIISPKHGKKYKAFDKLQCAGNGVCSRIYEYLYKGAAISLDRKDDLVKKAVGWAVHGTGKRKDRKRTALPISKEILLEKARELKSQKEIAKYFNCTPANISWHVKFYDIRKEMDKAIGKYKKEDIIRLYGLLGTYAAVARHVGMTKTRISQIIKEVEREHNHLLLK